MHTSRKMSAVPCMDKKLVLMISTHQNPLPNRGESIKPDHGRWPFVMVWLHGPTSMIHFTKPLGPSLSVNQIWTKRMTMHQKVNVLIFIIHAQKGQFGSPPQKKSLTGLLLSSTSLPQKHNSLKCLLTTLLCHKPLPFSTKTSLLPLSSQNPLDHVSG